ncbi:hypothetical protein [Methanolapillus millepedarum]|uniref:Uncharacterized protein n=1 Tax=Methanolapillus millepedarum TaxID=3028296 RepID=A0AA96V499_9EURY|nr:hypothetical protein MsAc7_07910 [Methanosarcinaceae archaeon Ac7]
MDENYYLRFPSILKGALIERTVTFGDDVQFRYEPILAYRVIKREHGNEMSVHRSDFKSKVEILKEERRGGNVDENNISHYSCSLFQDLEILKTVMRLPGPSRKIIQGFVTDSYGPCLMSDSHVDWWLFEQADPSFEFEVFT